MSFGTPEAVIRFSPGYYNPYSNSGFGPCWRVLGPNGEEDYVDTTLYPSLDAALAKWRGKNINLRIEPAAALSRHQWAWSMAEITA